MDQFRKREHRTREKIFWIIDEWIEEAERMGKVFEESGPVCHLVIFEKCQCTEGYLKMWNRQFIEVDVITARMIAGDSR